MSSRFLPYHLKCHCEERVLAVIGGALQPKAGRGPGSSAMLCPAGLEDLGVQFSHGDASRSLRGVGVRWPERHVG
jgi:hypothetical protein